jgi:hypothetical protein
MIRRREKFLSGALQKSIDLILETARGIATRHLSARAVIVWENA